MSPSEGNGEGPFPVTIRGSGLANVDSATAADEPAIDLVVVSDTELTCSFLFGEGTVDVTVSGPDGSYTLVEGFTFTFTQPTLGSVEPTSGPTAGGTTVTLRGSGLTGTTDVIFHAVAYATDVVVVDDNTVTCTSPPYSAGLAHVYAITPFGDVALYDAFEYV